MIDPDILAHDWRNIQASNRKLVMVGDLCMRCGYAQGWCFQDYPGKWFEIIWNNLS